MKVQLEEPLNSNFKTTSQTKKGPSPTIMPTKKAASEALAPNWLSRNLGMKAENTASKNPSEAWLKVKHMKGELRQSKRMSRMTGKKRLLTLEPPSFLSGDDD